jgi:hypothetical protein
MVGFEQFIERRPVHLDLIAMGNTQPGPAGRRLDNLGRRRMFGRPFIEQQGSHHRSRGTPATENERVPNKLAPDTCTG